MEHAQRLGRLRRTTAPQDAADRFERETGDGQVELLGHTKVTELWFRKIGLLVLILHPKGPKRRESRKTLEFQLKDCQKTCTDSKPTTEFYLTFKNRGPPHSTKFSHGDSSQLMTRKKTAARGVLIPFIRTTVSLSHLDCFFGGRCRRDCAAISGKRMGSKQAI